MNEKCKIKELEDKIERLHTELKELKSEQKSRKIINRPMSEQEFRNKLNKLKDKENITIVTGDNEQYNAKAGMEIGYSKCRTLESAGICLYGFIISVDDTVVEVY